MKPRIHFTPLWIILATDLVLLLASSPLSAQDNSHARIVRLSFTEGEVSVQRPDVEAWAQAPINTPLQEGFTLSTGDSSFAEIQFENGGTIRLGERSLLDLTQLERAPDGSTINKVELRQGYATFHPLPSRQGESIEVSTPQGRLIAQGGAQFRVDLEQATQRVEIFDGRVDLESNLGNLTIQKGSTLLLQPGSAEPPL